MTDNEQYYSDTTNPFATPREARGSGWAVFRLDQPKPVATGLTEAAADALVHKLAKDCSGTAG